MVAPLIAAGASIVAKSGLLNKVGSLLGGEQKHQNAKASFDQIVAAGAPEWLATNAINKAYGYAGPGYLSGARILKRDLESQQRDAAQLAGQIAFFSQGKTLTERQWAMHATELGIDVPASLSMADSFSLLGDPVTSSGGSGGGASSPGGFGFGGGSGPLLLAAAAVILFLVLRK